MDHDLTVIPASDLVAMDSVAGAAPLRIDIVYAKADHPENIFGQAIYRPEARLWLHRDFAEIVLRAAKQCHEDHGLVFVLKDGLRSVEAQEMIFQTEIVRANPHWTDPATRMFAPPGKGGHPRGMAIDVVLETEAGDNIDMGTCFDYMPDDPALNRAHRQFVDLSDDVRRNRKILEDSMVNAAAALNLPLFPLPHEWWDFRFPAEVFDRYAPLYDRDLPAEMRMTGPA